MPHAVEISLEVDEDVEDLTLVLHIFLNDDSAVEALFKCDLPSFEPSPFFHQQFLWLNFESGEKVA
ncbi:hypothetical protein DPMN_188664 [Dreissena polymorpha]|uniref:Uncharacterized protein n=1 Tax=Dreissena polymorpha TaxID=45954 RepID=A0A9D4DSJ0_DREPO|nr:hypothetical protein DPMN_188664 [Dreissena polymorpha]